MSIERLERAISATLDDTRIPDTAQAALDGAFAAIAQSAAATSATDASPATGARPRFAFPTWIRAATITCAVCLGIGGLGCAADRLGLIRLQQPSTHAAEIAVDVPNGQQVPPVVDEYRIHFTPPDIPYDTMQSSDDLTDYFISYSNIEDSDYQDFSLHVYYLDKAPGLIKKYVTGAETVEVNGREAAFIQQQSAARYTSYTLYLPFPDERRMVELSTTGLDREALLSCAETVSLSKTGRTTDSNRFWAWSEFIDQINAAPNPDTGSSSPIILTDEDMANLHQIGEAFAVPSLDENTFEVKVTDVHITDNLSPLACDEMIPASWKKLVDKDGKLGSDVITFTKFGDGTETLDEVLDTRKTEMALVHVTAQYTNVGDKTIEDGLFVGSLLSANHENGQWTIYDRAAECEGANQATYSSPSIGTGEASYFEQNGQMPENPDSPNSIRNLAPGESVEVHWGWLVSKDELDKLILSVDPSAGALDLSKSSAEIGYVDISQ